jgi:hypothetical protein
MKHGTMWQDHRPRRRSSTLLIFFLKMHNPLNARNLSIVNLESCVYDIDNWVLYYFVI